MAKIQIFKHGTDTSLGTGNGTVNTRLKTAIINSWDDKAGLETQKRYKLKAGRKIYANATCTAVNTVAPVANFTDVE